MGRLARDCMESWSRSIAACREVDLVTREQETDSVIGRLLLA